MIASSDEHQGRLATQRRTPACIAGQEQHDATRCTGWAQDFGRRGCARSEKNQHSQKQSSKHAHDGCIAKRNVNVGALNK